ncbi:unnamed protein product, partial [Nesidiocoris tenuis]
MEKSGDTFGRRLSKSTSPHDPERWRRPALPGALSGRRSSRYLNKRSHSLHPLFRPTSVRSIAAKFPGTFCTMPKLSPWARQISGKRLVEKWNSTRILFSTHRISSDSPFSPCIDLQSPRTALLFDLDVTIEQVMGQAFCYPSPNAVQHLCGMVHSGYQRLISVMSQTKTQQRLQEQEKPSNGYNNHNTYNKNNTYDNSYNYNSKQKHNIAYNSNKNINTTITTVVIVVILSTTEYEQYGGLSRHHIHPTIRLEDGSYSVSIMRSTAAEETFFYQMSRV